MKAFVAFSRWVNLLAEAALALLAAALTALVVGAVVSRYVFDLAIVTSVELTRIAFVWACFVGAAVGVARMAHVRVSVLVDLLPRPARMATALLTAAMIFGFGFAMVWYGLGLVQRMRPTYLPTLQWSQAVLYAALPASGALIMLHALAAAADTFIRGPEAVEPASPLEEAAHEMGRGP